MFGAAFIARRAVCAAQRVAISRPATLTRSIHVSAPVLKKKRAVVDSEDLFEEFEIVDNTHDKSALQAEAPGEGSTSKTTGKLTLEERQAKFDRTMSYLKPRLGRSPRIKHSVRDSAWMHLLQLATTDAQLKEAVKVMPQWKETGRKFTNTFSAAFVRRCQELRAPELALQVLGDFAKYAVPLDLATGRQLLHSVHKSIEQLMAASALFGLYGLPPVSQDLVSCSIIVDACLRHNSVHSLAIAEALTPHLRELKDTTSINITDTYHRENVWVLKAVEHINRTLKETDKPDIGPLLTTNTQGSTASL